MPLAIAGTIVATISLMGVAALIMRKKMGGRSMPPALQPGQPLPSFDALDENGSQLHSDDLRGRPTVILFVRGSWCPFCSRQVANLTSHYKDINELGARLILITPKPLQITHRVAKFFDVEFEFWLDERLAIAQQFGLVLTNGVPSDFHDEYGEDSYWPASIVVDAEGIIRQTWLSKFIMDRPNPEKLFQAVRSL